MKLAVIGGGGVRSPFLTKSIVKHAKSIGINEIVLMDVNAEKLNLFGRISQQVARMIDPDVQIRITTDLIEAIGQADLIITTIRSGGDESRVFDERTALNLGVLGQETTGGGGFAMALRSVPVLLDICKKARQHSKENVLLFNFTNPSGIVTQALRDEGFDFVYGICDAPSGFEKQLVRLLGAHEEDFQMTCFGLNHLSWFRDFKLNGRDVYDELIQHPDLFQKTELRYFNKSVIDMVGCRDLPNEYLYFYYFRDQAIESIISSDITRGEIILEINRKMIQALKEIDFDNQIDQAFDIFIRHYYERENAYFSIESGQFKAKQIQIPTLDEFINEPDEGGYAGVALKFIEAFLSGKSVRMVLSVPNQGAIDFLRDDDIVEVSCDISYRKVTPVPVRLIDDAQKNLILTIKSFERNTVKAIHNRDRNAAIKALMFHPLISSYGIADNLLDKYLEKYRDYVGDWIP